ncbi:MAG: FAD-binding protein, partial [Chromatocurvus sp.]
MTETKRKPDIDVRALLDGLRKVLPTQAVITDATSLRAWECDGLPLYCELPLAVVMPRDAGEVAAIMSLCHRLDVPVVPRGSGTGLSAGAMPHPEGVVLSLAGLDRIVAIDVPNRSARVQPGVTNLSISEAVAAHGLFYAPDPSSQIACSIGGNVAENAGGVHCLKYGLTVHNVMALTMITAEGEILTLGGSGLDTPGPDLLALMIGSEGLLGVVVEITVKLLPLPESVAVIMAGFDAVAAAGDAVGNIIA